MSDFNDGNACGFRKLAISFDAVKGNGVLDTVVTVTE
jgi:hypothetical protein